MDIVAESLSAKILKSKEVLVNGKDIMDYIRSKLSTAVEFNGVYDSLKAATAAGKNFNGSIVIVGSTEYIWTGEPDTGNWKIIGDETAVGQLATNLNVLSGNVDILSTYTATALNDLQFTVDTIAYKKFAIDSTTITANNNGSYQSFQLKMDAFDEYKVSRLQIQTGNIYAGLKENDQLSIIGSTASNVDNITESNTYFKSNVVRYPALSSILSANLTQTKSVANIKDAMYFFFSTAAGYENARLSVVKLNSIPSPDYIHTMNYWYPLVSVDAMYKYALTSDIPTYSQISSNIHLSDYALVNKTSSDVQLSTKFDTLSTYIQTKSQLSIDGYVAGVTNGQATANQFVTALEVKNGKLSVAKAEISIPSGISSYIDTKNQLSNDGYATSSSIPSYNDISTNIHLSNYALANSVSSTTELNAKFNTLSTYSQTKQQLSSDGYALSSTTSQVANALSNAISSKVYVGNLQSGEHTDLSVLKVTSDEYEQLVADANSSGVDLSNNVIYVVSSDNMNMYGEKILNLTMTEDDEPSEATNKHYVDSYLSSLSSKIDVLSTYEQTKSQLSDDGYATQSNIPSYSDISVNIHLSDYALSNDISSKVDLEAAFNQKLDATAAGKAFSPLSTYSLYEHVSYNGQLYECSAVVSAPSGFQLSNWQLVDMTSPDATLDITNQGQLRLVAADGTTLWHQGYDLAVSSSTTLSIDAVNRYDFAWNATSATALTIPTSPNGKVGDFILDVTLTALAPFLSTVSYAAGRHVIQDGICWTSTTSADAGAWDTVSANWTQDYAAWDSTSTYTSADNPIVKDGSLWKCVAASTTAGDWTPSDWTTASFGLPQLEAESIKVVVPEDNSLADMLTFAPGQMAELYFTQTSFTASGQPTWKVVRQNVEEAGV